VLEALGVDAHVTERLVELERARGVYEAWLRSQ
jgi:hypothetical protein